MKLDGWEQIDNVNSTHPVMVFMVNYYDKINKDYSSNLKRFHD